MARKMTRNDVKSILHILDTEIVSHKNRIWASRKNGFEPNGWDVEQVDRITELMEVFGEYMKNQDLRRQ